MKYDVFGLGDTLMDILIEVDDQYLLEWDLKKGQFHSANKEKIKEIMEKLKDKKNKITPAGSCANTIFGIASLGGNAVLCGKVGRDRHGDIFEEIVIKEGIKSRIKRSDIDETGTVINLVTPDSERTFVVNLGANINLKKEDLHDVEEDIKQSKILHLTGYYLGDSKTRETSLHAMNIAKENNVKISIDLADPGVIKRNLKDFKNIVKKYADIIFLNEEEARIFTGKEPEEAISELGDYADIAIVKLGNKGSLINDRGAIIMIPVVKAKAIDTTGAGDLYAAGILYGICNGYDLEKAGKLASTIAAKIVEQVGARPEFDLKAFI